MAKTQSKPKKSVKSGAKTKKTSAVKVGTGRKTTKVTFLQDTKGKLAAVLAFFAIGLLSLVYVHAATTTSTLWSGSAVPQTITTGDTSAATLGTTFESKYSGNVIGVRFYKSAQNTGTHIGSLWTTKGVELASVTFTNESSSGWQEADFSNPVSITANTPYVIAYYAPHGHYSQTKHYFTKDYTNSPLTAPAARNGVYVFTNNSAYPTKVSRSQDNYWVDAVFSTSTFNPTPAPAAPTNLTGSVSNGTVSLQWQASPSIGITSYTILRNSNAIASVPVTGTLQYHDTPTTGNSYTYAIEAVDQANDVSAPSNTVTLTVPTPTNPSPAPTPTPTPAPVPTPLGNNVISVSTSAELTAALANVQPGETIELANGTYNGNFVATTSGTANAPITLYGSSQAILNSGNLGSGYGFYLNGANYWQLVDFSVTNAGKGIVLDGSSHSIINGVTVFNIGDEGIHLRKGSSYDVVESSAVYNTGQKTATYGEGIYAGSAIKNWPLYWSTTDQYGNKVDGSDYNEILDNTVTKTGAENIDTKEGTHDTLIAGNILSSPGAGSGAIDVKGNNYTIENNNISNAPNNDHAAIEVWELVTGYGQNNLLSGNNLGSTGSGLGIYASSGTVGTIVKCSNTVSQPTAGLSNGTCTQ